MEGALNMATAGKDLHNSASSSSTHENFVDDISDPHSVQLPDLTFEEKVSGPYETVIVRRTGNKERRKTLSNFVLNFKYVIRGAKSNKHAVSGWWVELLATTFAETTSLLIPATALNTDKELLRFLQLNTEAGALLTLSATNDTMRAFIAWKQAKFMESDPENRLVREYVLNLGIQPDGMTLIMGKESRGLYVRGQDGELALHEITSNDCKYFWSDAVGLADFGTNLFTDGGNLVQLLKSVFSERYELNFYSLLGYETLPFFADYVRTELKCPTPVPVLTGPTGSGKTRKFEYVGAIVGYDRSDERAWRQLNFVTASIVGVETALKSHHFPLMVSDAKNMAVLESVTKQVFDHAGKVNNRGIHAAATGLILGCNPEILEKYMEKIDPSTRERHVILEQKPLLREITEDEKTALGHAREMFSGNLAKIANPDTKTKFLQDLRTAYLTLKAEFLQILLKKGVGSQASRLAETYGLVLALGSAMYCCLNEDGLSDVVSKYLGYFKESLCEMVMVHQIRGSSVTEAELPDLLCQALVQFMKINPKWHSSLHWPISSKELDQASCVGIRTSEIFSVLEESTDATAKLLLKNISVSAVTAWLRRKEGNKKRATNGSINGLCHGISMFGDILPLRHLEVFWKTVTEEAKRQNHEPDVRRCAYHAKRERKAVQASEVGEKDLVQGAKRQVSPTMTIPSPAKKLEQITMETNNHENDVEERETGASGESLPSASDAVLPPANPAQGSELFQGNPGNAEEPSATAVTNDRVNCSQFDSAGESSGSGIVHDFTMEFPRELDNFMGGTPSYADDLEKTRESLGLSTAEESEAVAINTRSKRTLAKKSENISAVPPRVKAANESVAATKVCAVCGAHKGETQLKAGRFMKCKTCTKWLHVKCKKNGSFCSDCA